MTAAEDAAGTRRDGGPAGARTLRPEQQLDVTTVSIDQAPSVGVDDYDLPHLDLQSAAGCCVKRLRRRPG